MDQRITRIKHTHVKAPTSPTCTACNQPYPCDTVLALEEITRLEIENAHLDHATLPLQAETGLLRARIAVLEDILSKDVPNRSGITPRSR